MYSLTVISMLFSVKLFTLTSERSVQDDHFSVKPGNIREFDRCRGNDRNYGEEIFSGKTVYC